MVTLDVPKAHSHVHECDRSDESEGVDSHLSLKTRTRCYSFIMVRVSEECLSHSIHRTQDTLISIAFFHEIWDPLKAVPWGAPPCDRAHLIAEG